MRELYHGVEIEVVKESSHIGWTRLYWSLRRTDTWEEIDAGIEKDGSMKGLIEKLKLRVDRERREE